MSDVPADSSADSPAVSPAEPIVGKMRWPFPIIWIVPLIAAAIAGYYLYYHTKQRGPEITISFADADGLNPGETPVRVKGVAVGVVSGTALDAARKRTLVQVKLNGDYADLASSGTAFWIVRPQFNGGDFTGLSTVLSGPYIQALPGKGNGTTDFTGLESAPVMLGTGMRFIVHTDRLEHLNVGAPVYFRGIQVGVVQDVRLGAGAMAVNATIFIWQRFTGLVRRTSEFWSVGGADVKGGVFTGVDVRINSLQSFLAGGIMFATPDEGMPATDGTSFTLHKDAKDEWLKWNPALPLGEDDGKGGGK
ncbi:MAG: MCE family protein [Phycisphaerae bacterium]|nr:MCE family protein [Phycisphaerae bacterium]